MEKCVRTVLGEVAPGDLGVVLPHEHVLVDFRKAMVTGPVLRDGRSLTNLDLVMENMGLVRRFPYSVHDNLILEDVSTAVKELEVLKANGGGTLCEMSVVGMRRDNHTPQDLVRISTSTGLHVISATGFYWGNMLPEWVWSLSVRAMADLMMSEVVKGVAPPGDQEVGVALPGDVGVKCGVIYVGCSHPLMEVEKHALQAAAITHKDTGVAMAISPGICPSSPKTVVEYLCCHGVPEQAISLVHNDRTFTS